MSFKPTVATVAFIMTLATPGLLRAAEKDLLIHWTFDEGNGAITRDLSGSGLDGKVAAQWTESPRGQALFCDGTSKTVVKTSLDEEQRFGKRSWTFMAWVKPKQLTIDAPQKQRRIFSFGKYPDAYLVIDITERGTLSCYFCHKDGEGKIVSAGCSSRIGVRTNEWAHLAVVCDRDNRRIWPYINGYSQGATDLNPAFDGDFSLGSDLTVGSHWHNYWGLVDDVRIYRRALAKEEIRQQYGAYSEIYSVIEPPDIVDAKRRERLAEEWGEANRAWVTGDFDRVRAACAAIVSESNAPPHYRSCAHLRIAQSYRIKRNPSAAEGVYREIAATDAYPTVHREEARECAEELDRSKRGLPPRHAEASRTRLAPIPTFAAEVFVSVDGNDDNRGTVSDPFATLRRARDTVRALRDSGVSGPVAVTVKPGQYLVTNTLELTTRDSGTEDAPVVYRAAEKGKTVFYGGKSISGLTRVSDPAIRRRLPKDSRDAVWQCDLKAQGITDYGELRVRGFAQPPSPPTLEIYFNGKPLTLARWPNEGFVGIRKLVESGSRAEKEPSVFEYIDDRHARWTEATDAWLFGYFHFLWADATASVASIDTNAHTITTAEPYHYGGRGMSTRQGIAYYAFNLLEEIDQPGEWYLDRDTGMLYLYPPSDPAYATVEIGIFARPIVSLKDVSHVRFEGLAFDLCRYDGIHIRGGENCCLAGCSVQRMAGCGVSIVGGYKHALVGCDVHTTGRRATEVVGGDRETLTPAGHLVENCRIHNFARIDRTYNPAIQLEGVGNRVAHNLLYNCPSSVMRIEGNDHVIEFNEVHSAVQESDDQGAMELFRNATYRGVVFRHNYFHQVGKTGSEAAVHGQAAIRFDDAISGMVVYGNVFHQCANGNFGAIQMNSGRDNVIDNNIFVDCKQALSGGWNRNNNVWKALRAGTTFHGFYTNSLYLSRYPTIAHMLNEPALNHVWRNVFYRCGRIARSNPTHLDLCANGEFPDANPGFENEGAGDFRIRPDAHLFSEVAFRPIPVGEIGLYEDTYRATWPVVAATATMPDWRTTEE